MIKLGILLSEVEEVEVEKPLARRNYQPQSEEAWTDNQESGYFGHVSSEREKKAKDFLTELRA